MTLARKLSLFAPPIVYCALIFSLSAQPKLPESPGGDKVAHLTAYAVMGLLFTRAAFHSKPAWSAFRTFAIAAVLAALYGVSDEIHQAFVPGRNPSLGDVLADAVGSLIGSAGAIAFYRHHSARGAHP